MTSCDEGVCSGLRTGETGGSLASQLANLDPSIEAVVKNLEQFAVAEAEIESVLAAPSEASPSGHRQPSLEFLAGR